MDTDLWRTQLPSDARERIVNKIMELLKRHVPYSGQEGLEMLRRVAVHFEEKTYTGASDYLRKISVKMLTMESKSQNTFLNSLPPNPSGNNNRPPDAGVSIWRSTAAQGAEPSAETGGDWKTLLPPDSRQRNVNVIMEMLKRNLPYSGEEGLAELMRIAVRFEEKAYTDATSQSDYMRKIWMKRLELGSRPLNTEPNPLSPIPSGNNNRPLNVGVSVLRPNAAQDARPVLLQQQQSMQQQRLQILTQQHAQLHQLQQGQLHRQMRQQQGQLRKMQQLQQQLQQPQQLEHLMAMQNNLSRMHEQQLGSQSNVSGSLQQQQQLGTQPGNSTTRNNQPSLHMLQRPNVPLQQQTVQNSFLELGCI